MTDEQLAELVRQMKTDRAATGVAVSVLREREDPNRVWVMGAFESEDAYRRNADSPEQNARFERMQALVDGQPEWHDGDVLAAVHRDAPGSYAV